MSTIHCVYFNMVVIYDSALTEPPSSIHCFRDVTMYNEVFLKNDNLLECPKGTRSLYWKWIKQYGAHDFVKELLIYEERQNGLRVGSNGDIEMACINEYSYRKLINILQSIIT
jgi:hypothetical protein